MKKSDFYYNLPEELDRTDAVIEPRDHSRLMQIDRKTGGDLAQTIFLISAIFCRRAICL